MHGERWKLYKVVLGTFAMIIGLFGFVGLFVAILFLPLIWFGPWALVVSVPVAMAMLIEVVLRIDGSGKL